MVRNLWSSCSSYRVIRIIPLVTMGRRITSDDSSSKPEDRRAIHVTRHQTMPTSKSTGAGISMPTYSKASPYRRSETVSQFPLPRRSIHSKHLKRSATTGTSTQRHLPLYSDGKDDSVSASVKTHTKSTTPTPTPRNTLERNVSKSLKTDSEIKEKSPNAPPPIPSKTVDDVHSLTPSKDATIRDSARRDQSSPDVPPEKAPPAEEAKTNSLSLRNMKRLMQLFKKS